MGHQEGWPGLAQYTPSVPADWSPRPRTVQDALDQLAAGGSAVAAANMFVWQPGGVTAGNVYATFAALETALQDIKGPKVVGVDTSLGAATIPAAGMPAAGWRVNDTTWQPCLATASVTISIAVGAKFDPATVNLTFQQCTVSNAATASVWTPATVAFLRLNTSQLVSTAAGAFMDIAVAVAVEIEDSSLVGNGTNTVFKVEAAGALSISLLTASNVQANAIAQGAAPGGTVNTIIDASAFLSSTQGAGPVYAQIITDPQPTFVFAPGATGSQNANVFTTWPALMAARNQVRGFARIELDNSQGACHATAAATPWNIGDTYFASVDVSTNASRTLIIDDGALFSGSAVVWWENVILENHNTVTSPFVAAGGVQLSHKFYFGGPQCVGGATPMYGKPAAGQTVSCSFFASAAIANAGAPVFANDAAGGTVFIRLLDNASLAASTLTGTGAITVRYVNSATFSATQGGLTTLTLTPTEPANPTQASNNTGTGTGAVSVQTGNIQQKKSGQVLVIANMAGTTSAGTTVTLQLVRDAATNIGNVVVETTLSAGDGFHGSIAFVDTLPDAAVHTYKCTGTAGAGNITAGGANSFQITAVEL